MRKLTHFVKAAEALGLDIDLIYSFNSESISIEELEKLGKTPSGSQGNAPYLSKDKKPYLG